MGPLLFSEDQMLHLFEKSVSPVSQGGKVREVTEKGRRRKWCRKDLTFNIILFTLMNIKITRLHNFINLVLNLFENTKS